MPAIRSQTQEFALNVVERAPAAARCRRRVRHLESRAGKRGTRRIFVAHRQLAGQVTQSRHDASHQAQQKFGYDRRSLCVASSSQNT
jgi:hypothetical protein